MKPSVDEILLGVQKRANLYWRLQVRIAYINYSYESSLTPSTLPTRYELLHGWAQGVHDAGARGAVAGPEITVFQRLGQTATRTHEGIAYRYVADGCGPALRPWQVPHALHRQVRAFQPDVVHLHGLIFPLQTLALRRTLPMRCALVAQHHGERPSRGWRKWLQAWALRHVDAAFFTATGLIDAWRAHGHIHPTTRTYAVMEGSTHFTAGDKAQARASTGLIGNPVVLWVGRLNANKDPLTMLGGFETALAHKPHMRLYMAFGDETLLPQVLARIQSSAALAHTVTLLGRVPHAWLENYFRSADFYVSASHSEGSGIALLEALACGVVPIVTDIAAFRALTDNANGRVGALWQPGNTASLAQALLALLNQPYAPLSQAAVDFFNRELTYAAIGRQALAAYTAEHQRCKNRVHQA